MWHGLPNAGAHNPGYGIILRNVIYAERKKEIKLKSAPFLAPINLQNQLLFLRREGMFFISGGRGGGGVGPGLRMAGSLLNFLQIGEGQTCFIFNRGRVTVFWQGENYSMSLLFCIYKQSYQSRLI